MKLVSFLYFLYVVTSTSASTISRRGKKGDEIEGLVEGSVESVSIDSDDTDDKMAKSMKRECKNSGKKDSVTAECSAKEGKMKDVIKFEIAAGRQGAEVGVKYKGENETETVEMETEEKYAIFFHSLVEYIPNISTGSSFDFDYDSVKQEVVIEKWADFSPITVGEDGVSFFSVATQDDLARFDFYLSQEANDIRNLSANSVKIDVTISNFPWMHDYTNLALLCTIEAEKEIEYDYEKQDSEKGKDEEVQEADKTEDKDLNDEVILPEAGEASVAANKYDSEMQDSSYEEVSHPKDIKISLKGAEAAAAAQPFGKFDWVTTAELNNSTNTSRVVASTNEDEESKKAQKIAFSFLDSSMAEIIYWDPEAGIGYETIESDATLGTDGATEIYGDEDSVGATETNGDKDSVGAFGSAGSFLHSNNLVWSLGAGFVFVALM